GGDWSTDTLSYRRTHGRDRRRRADVPRPADHRETRGPEARAAGSLLRRLPRDPPASGRRPARPDHHGRERSAPELRLQQHARLLRWPGGRLRRAERRWRAADPPAAPAAARP